MAERLTNTLEETPKKGFGLKFCSNRNCNSEEDCCNCYAFNATINKLRQLEDIMEKYDIEDLEQLDIMLFCLSSETKFQLKQLQKLYKKYNIKSMEELEKKLADSDTWQKACELACEELNCSDNYGSKTYIMPLKEMPNYFYQQAKTEGNDEK